MSNRDQGIGPRKSNKTGPTIHDIRVDNSPSPREGDGAAANHTPLPWRLGTRYPSRVLGGTVVVAMTCDPQDQGTENEREKADAALIVSAVNQCASLLARVERLEEACKKALTCASIDSGVRELIRAALSGGGK